MLIYFSKHQLLLSIIWVSSLEYVKSDVSVSNITVDDVVNEEFTISLIIVFILSSFTGLCRTFKSSKLRGFC